jgi:hypothetical protein
MLVRQAGKASWSLLEDESELRDLRRDDPDEPAHATNTTFIPRVE